MGTSVKQIYFRTSSVDYASLQDVANHFNTITAAFLECGMLPVSADDYPGQAGTFVTTTPGAGETQIVAAAANSGNNVYGYNLFKHPVMSLYVLVRYSVHKAPSYAYRYGNCIFNVFRRLEDEGSATTIYPMDNNSAYNADYAAIKNGAKFLHLSCDNDSFWVYSESAINYAYHSNSYAFNGGNISNYTLAVFSSREDPESICVVSSDNCELVSTAYVTGPSVTSANSTGVKVAVSAGSAYPFVQAPRGSICTLVDPAEPAANSATRIARAEKIINGQRCSFDFAWINAAAMNDLATATLDIHGEGAKQYIALRGFGSGGAYRWNSTLNSVAMPLMPWNP